MILKIKRHSQDNQAEMSDYLVESNEIQILSCKKHIKEAHITFDEDPRLCALINGKIYAFNSAYLMNNDGKTIEKY